MFFGGSQIIDIIPLPGLETEVVHVIILYSNHTAWAIKIFEAIRVLPSQLPVMVNCLLQKLQQSF